MILLLTRNVNKEQYIKALLETLGYDVFCSVQLLDALLSNKKEMDLFDYFPVVVISETIFESEFEQAKSLLCEKGHIIVRKTNSVTGLQESKVDGVCEIPLAIGLEELRDTLDEMKAKESYEKKSVRESMVSLSMLEKKIVKQLYTAFPDKVSRDQLIQQLWGDDDTTKSRLSSLSNCVHSINQKMRAIQPSNEEKAVKTLWRKGYFLDDEVYSSIEEERLIIL